MPLSWTSFSARQKRAPSSGQRSFNAPQHTRHRWYHACPKIAYHNCSRFVKTMCRQTYDTSPTTNRRQNGRQRDDNGATSVEMHKEENRAGGAVFSAFRQFDERQKPSNRRNAKERPAKAVAASAEPSPRRGQVWPTTWGGLRHTYDKNGKISTGRKTTYPQAMNRKRRPSSKGFRPSPKSESALSVACWRLSRARERAATISAFPVSRGHRDPLESGLYRCNAPPCRAHQTQLTPSHIDTAPRPRYRIYRRATLRGSTSSFDVLPGKRTNPGRSPHTGFGLR